MIAQVCLLTKQEIACKNQLKRLYRLTHRHFEISTRLFVRMQLSMGKINPSNDKLLKSGIYELHDYFLQYNPTDRLPALHCMNLLFICYCFAKLNHINLNQCNINNIKVILIFYLSNFKKKKTQK